MNFAKISPLLRAEKLDDEIINTYLILCGQLDTRVLFLKTYQFVGLLTWETAALQRSICQVGLKKIFNGQLTELNIQIYKSSSNLSDAIGRFSSIVTVVNFPSIKTEKEGNERLRLNRVLDKRELGNGKWAEGGWKIVGRIVRQSGAESEVRKELGFSFDAVPLFLLLSNLQRGWKTKEWIGKESERDLGDWVRINRGTGYQNLLIYLSKQDRQKREVRERRMDEYQTKYRTGRSRVGVPYRGLRDQKMRIQTN